MKIVQKIITVLLALVVFAGATTYELELSKVETDVLHTQPFVVPNANGGSLIREGKIESFSNQQGLLVGDSVQTSDQQTAVIAFGKGAEMRLSQGSSLRFLGEDIDQNGYVFQLEKGRLWVSTVYSTSTVNILSGATFVLPSKSTFDIAYDGSSAIIQVFDNQVDVGLTTPGFSPQKLYLSMGDNFINHFLVASGNQTIISNQKVAQNVDVLRKLLYSKLIKEFQYNRFDPKILSSDPWITANIDLDKELQQKISKNRMDLINQRNLRVSSIDDVGYQMGKLIDGFANVLTFSSDRIVDRQVNAIITHVLDAEYLLAYGRSTEATSRLNLFKKMISEIPSENREMVVQKLYSKLEEIYQTLAFVSANDPLFSVRSTVADVLLSSPVATDDDVKRHFTYIRDYLIAGVKVSSLNEGLARNNLDAYYDRFTKFVASQSNQRARLKSFVYEDNQIFDNVLKQYPTFYQDTTFAKKHSLELEWLKFIPEGNEKNEERQTMISTKIDFLKMLQTFVLDEKVSLKEAKPIATRLFSEIQDYKTGDDVAVSQLFNLRLQDYGQFLRFLNATDISSLKGFTIRDKFENFKANQLEQVSIEKAIEDFLGDKATSSAPTITVEQILTKIRADFDKIQVTDLDLGTLNSIEQKNVTINSANLNGTTFSGVYDWDKKLVSNVRVGTEILSVQGLRLESLNDLLTPQEQTPPPAPQPPPTPEDTTSKADRVAKILLIQKLKGSGIASTEANIVIQSSTAGTFVVNGASLIKNQKVQFAFAFNNKENVATSLLVRTDSGDQQISEKLALEDLAAKAQSLYDAGKKSS